MTTSAHRTPMSWSARLLVALVLLLAGAGAITWAMARYPPVARLLGVAASNPAPLARPAFAEQERPAAALSPAPASGSDPRIAALEARIGRVEATTQSAVGSAGRADALLVAFAARRAVERGVALGYLENLLVQRFGAQHQAAVSTIISASRSPVRLEELQTEYDQLGPVLRSGGANESLWASLGRELGSLVEVRRADRPPADLDSRYRRASQQLALGRVDTALAETMRMPGAGNATRWVNRARRYTAAQRALDEIESAALLGGGGSG